LTFAKFLNFISQHSSYKYTFPEKYDQFEISKEASQELAKLLV